MDPQSPLSRESRTSGRKDAYRSRAGERHSHNTSTEPSRDPDTLLGRFYRGRSNPKNRTDYSPRNRSPPPRHERAQPADSAFPQQSPVTSHRPSLSSDPGQHSSQREISVATDVIVSQRHHEYYELSIYKRTCGTNPMDDQRYGTEYKTPMPRHENIDTILFERPTADGAMTLLPTTRQVQFQFYGNRVGHDRIEMVEVTKHGMRPSKFDELYRWARESEPPSLFKSHVDGNHSNDRF